MPLPFKPIPMKVSGFTFIRNAVRFDYPVVEAITSILPLCDEFIVALGNSDDNTRQLIESIPSDKIRVIPTIWDESLRDGGKLLAVETDKAYAQISSDADWAFYIQADEVIHEKYLPNIQQAMLTYKDDKRVEGLLFNYLHFYSSYDYVGDSRKWYRREVRIIRKGDGFHSYGDAQGFRRYDRHLRVIPINAFVYHYGWVKHPSFQQEKQKSFHRLWHSDEWMKKNITSTNEFDYSKHIDSLKHFTDSHPGVIKQRIQNKNWELPFDPSIKKMSSLKKLHYFFEEKTGWRIGEYKNFKIIK